MFDFENNYKKSIKGIRLTLPSLIPVRNYGINPHAFAQGPFIPFLLAGITHAGKIDFFFLFLFFGNNGNKRGNALTVKTRVDVKLFFSEL
ncbi:hypothetical protein HDF24_07425 [Mucilaginibacter sp. X4EP1]|uniref:hypothetical protein n=1 Tax=Mucilaginibacter sp. X4EP1 TaxID=2723092 RepID=UPI002167F920|nr:hypothetical protein [Mucilaginibacter sp. X4EP1]MCS3814143.1 hypothetical protein [Mucilaginibacter sp. X4EP1]